MLGSPGRTEAVGEVVSISDGVMGEVDSLDFASKRGRFDLGSEGDDWDMSPEKWTLEECLEGCTTLSDDERDVFLQLLLQPVYVSCAQESIHMYTN